MRLSDEVLSALETRLGHSFSNRRLLSRALTHRSATNTASYERLEFLGDRVLGLVVADLLLQGFPEDQEGNLSRRFNALVRKETLADIAIGLELGPVIQFGQSEEEAGGQNHAILSDVVEALIAAIYRDAGFDAARKFVEKNWKPRLSDDPTPPRDGKSALQEWTMARGLGLPRYEERGRSGPDHAPEFTIRVSVPNHGFAEASGKAKRRAEQTAAQTLLERLRDGGE